MDPANRRPTMIVCQRTAEMRSGVEPPPGSCFTETCDDCKAPLTIFPSGVRVIAEFGRDKVQLACNACYEAEAGEHSWLNRPLVPGAFPEILQAIVQAQEKKKAN